jgi:hypothetical protein
MGIGLAYKFDNRRRAAFRKLSRSLFPVIIPGL